MRKALAILFLLVSVFVSGADNVYVREGAPGDNDGTDWANAYTSLPASQTLIRGNVYYIADGNYSAYAFRDNEIGTNLITIKKAIESDHGTETGWDSSYGDGQAVFGNFLFYHGYYNIDGQTGGGPTNWEGGFGFRVNSLVETPTFDGHPRENITLSHIDIHGTATGPDESRGMWIYGIDNFTMRYCYLHDVGCDMITMNRMNNFTIEYSKLARNHQAEPGCHGDLIEYQVGDAVNFVIRYNFIEDIVGSYAFGSHNPTINGYYIYGNIFYWTETPFFGNGLVGMIGNSSGDLINVKFFNNTISGNFNTEGNMGFGLMRGSGNAAYNNIWHRTSGTGIGFGGYSTATNKNNTFYNGSGSWGENLTGDPFVNQSGRDFHLKAPSSSGYTILSPYNVDMFGTPRGGYANYGDGNWDRGALEFVPLLISPQNLRIGSGQTVQFYATNSVNGVLSNVTDSATWASSIPGIASIDASGLATANQIIGKTVISATWSNLSAVTDLFMTNAAAYPPSFISINFLPDEHDYCTIAWTTVGQCTNILDLRICPTDEIVSFTNSVPGNSYENYLSQWYDVEDEIVWCDYRARIIGGNGLTTTSDWYRVCSGACVPGALAVGTNWLSVYERPKAFSGGVIVSQ